MSHAGPVSVNAILTFILIKFCAACMLLRIYLADAVLNLNVSPSVSAQLLLKSFLHYNFVKNTLGSSIS